jgi:bifunctional non-homologous end joining protein LigD
LEPPLPNPHLDRAAVAAYYRSIAQVMLPFVAGRPLNVVRCYGRKCWFQRNENHPATEPGTFGSAVGRLPIEQKNGRTERYLYVSDELGIAELVGADTVEFHGWGSRIEDVDRQDRLVIDLDPDEGLGFAPVREAAFEVRRGFDFIGLTCFPLLSGGKGVHVVVPLEPEADWGAIREFAFAFSRAMVEAQPERFTAALPKKERAGRIFLDYLRNHRTATAVLPYSVRAREGAPVAAPVSWAELECIDTAAEFSIGDAACLKRRAETKALAGWGRANQRLPG